MIPVYDRMHVQRVQGFDCGVTDHKKQVRCLLVGREPLLWCYNSRTRRIPQERCHSMLSPTRNAAHPVLLRAMAKACLMCWLH